MPIIKCRECGEEGHLSIRCPLKGPDKQAKTWEEIVPTHGKKNMSTSSALNANAPPFVPKTPRTIRVVLLRHGEREDETEDYDKRQHSRQERIDPALTAFGHRQALHAWEKILATLPKDDDDKPIMLASSPLRRCMGTAMMVAAAAASIGNTDVSFVLPSAEANKEDGPASSTAIPILVMNGLGDCAAQMQHMGGIGKVVKGGWLQCGASPANDARQEGSPLQGCLQDICATAATVQVQEAAKQKEKSHRAFPPSMECSLAPRKHHTRGDGLDDEEMGVQENGTPSSVADEPPARETPKLQFWRETHYHYTEQIPQEHVTPMTRAQTFEEHAQAAPSATTPKDPPAPMPKNAPSRDEGCDQALERAVWLTHHAGLDTCILVTHREAIRFVEHYWVAPPPANGGRRRRTSQSTSATRMYCCVAVYKVTLDPEANQILGWNSQGVVPYQLLDPFRMLF